MSEMSKDRWIDEVVASTDGMQRAKAPEGLFTKIDRKLASGVKAARKVPFSTVGLAAASIVLLVTINIYMLKGNTKKSVQQSTGIEQVVEYYGLNEETFNY